MEIRSVLLWCLVVSLLAGRQGTAASESDWRWSGSLRSLNLLSEVSPANTHPAFRISNSSLRLEPSWQMAPDWRLDVAGDLWLLATHPAGFMALPENGVNRRLDLDRHWNWRPGWDSGLQLDRFSLGWSGRRLGMTLGRQAIGFGRMALFSPLDVIAPFPPDALDTDYRPGVDALRVTGYYGQNGQVGMITVLGDTANHNSYLLTWVDNRAGVDLLAVFGRLREREMAGFGVAGNLGSLGLKGEVVFYEGIQVGEAGGDLFRRMAIGAVEGWYRFDCGIVLIAEYLYNGAGVKDPDRYVESLFSAPRQEGWSPLLGRHYLLVSGNYELHPLAKLSGLFIWNLRDDSWMLRPTLSISLTDNTSLEIFLTCTQGDSRSPVPAVKPASEFGIQGTNGGFFITYFF